MVIYDQWQTIECKGYWFLTALTILNPKVDASKVISAINEDPAWLVTNRKAGEFFKARWFIKWYEVVPRLRAKALLNRSIPLVATVTGVDWAKTSKPPYIAVFENRVWAHSCTIVWYDNKTRMLKIANTYWPNWWDNWFYYIHASNLTRMTQFCRLII
jgi:hypothetical protein